MLCAEVMWLSGTQCTYCGKVTCCMSVCLPVYISMYVSFLSISDSVFRDIYVIVSLSAMSSFLSVWGLQAMCVHSCACAYVHIHVCVCGCVSNNPHWEGSWFSSWHRFLSHCSLEFKPVMTCLKESDEKIHHLVCLKWLFLASGECF